MSDIYSTLQVSPRKRRTSDPEDAVSTPKKLRSTPLTPSSISRRAKVSGTPSSSKKLPDPLTRLCTIHNSLQRAISHALATCAVSPTGYSGHLRNVVNHYSLKTYSGLSSSFELDDLKRFCWLWEWDGKKISELTKTKTEERQKGKQREKEDNPFLDEPDAVSEDWTRGGMGFLITATTHLSKQARQRIPAYGVGIEIEINIDKGMESGMAAVARWTSEADARQKELIRKVKNWVEIHQDLEVIPPIPIADLPALPSPIKASSLTMKLASVSPKGARSKSLLFPPTSSVPSPTKLLTKQSTREFTLPFPTLSPSTSPIKKSSIIFPQTPRHKRIDASTVPITPQTPSQNIPSDAAVLPETPTKQTGTNAETMPVTPSSSKRQALYERIRQKSLTASPGLGSSGQNTPKAQLSRDQMLRLSQEETRRRCILGRLDKVAESVWMCFSEPAGGSCTTPSRKRRAKPAFEVATAIVKSSQVPISVAEANESLVLLIKLCPFFLKRLDIQGEEWLEMPASSSNKPHETPGTRSANATPTKRALVPPCSPGSKFDSAELIHRSPKRVKKEVGGLREVREIIRRELELQD